MNLRHVFPLIGICLLLFLNLGGCGSTAADAPAGAAAGANDNNSSAGVAAAGNAPPSAAMPPAAPATLAEAARALDLNTFPLAPNAQEEPARSLAQLTYDADGSPKEAFAFVKRQLAAQKWQELPGAYLADEGASATFARDGHQVSVSVFPAGSGKVRIAMTQHGNCSPASLPVPEGTAPLHKGPVSAIFVAPGSVEETVAAVDKLLRDAGWEPYGSAGDSRYYKQNAVRIGARVAAAPAQEGKTMIEYTAQLLSADLPLPPGADKVQFSDVPTQLSFDVAASPEDAAKFYREALAKQGWQATTENLIDVNRKQVLIFRNPEKDLVELQFTTVEGQTRALVKYQTAAHVAKIEAAFQAEMERRKREGESSPAEEN